MPTGNPRGATTNGQSDRLGPVTSVRGRFREECSGSSRECVTRLICRSQTGLTLDFIAGIASYRTETDDTVTYDAPAGYRVESDNDLIHRVKVHQLQALSATTGDFT